MECRTQEELKVRSIFYQVLFIPICHNPLIRVRVSITHAIHTISKPRTYCKPYIGDPSHLRNMESDNPQVQGIIVAIPKGGSDKYGVSNRQELNVRSIFSQVLSATDTTLRAPNVCFQLETEIKLCCGYKEDNFA